MENYFSNINLLRLFLKWKWHLVIVVVVVAVGAAIFSGPSFIQPRYKSTAVFYPSNIAPYSDESQTEQMLQWCNSQDIKDSLIERFDLYKHWKVDRNYEYAYTTMMYYFSEYIVIQKTPYASIEIKVLDKDPQQACAITEAILDLVNIKIKGIQKQKFGEVVALNRNMLQIKQAEMDALQKRLQEYATKYELIEYESQAEQVAKGYLGTMDGNSRAGVDKEAVKRLKKNMEERGAGFLTDYYRMERIANEYSQIRSNYDLAIKDFNRDFTYVNVVSKPFVADKKAYPVRWLIVFYSVMVALFLSIVTIAVLENRNQLKVTK